MKGVGGVGEKRDVALSVSDLFSRRETLRGQSTPGASAYSDFCHFNKKHLIGLKL